MEDLDKRTEDTAGHKTQMDVAGGVRCAARVCIVAVGVWAVLTATRAVVTVGACVALWRFFGLGGLGGLGGPGGPGGLGSAAASLCAACAAAAPVLRKTVLGQLESVLKDFCAPPK
jgi:hypothetical protein